jgi:hypothetical protein
VTKKYRLKLYVGGIKMKPFPLGDGRVIAPGQEFEADSAVVGAFANRFEEIKTPFIEEPAKPGSGDSKPAMSIIKKRRDGLYDILNPANAGNPINTVGLALEDARRMAGDGAVVDDSNSPVVLIVPREGTNGTWFDVLEDGVKINDKALRQADAEDLAGHKFEDQ